MDRQRKTQLIELTHLMQTERADMLRYACYRLGNIEEARDVLHDVYINIHTQICNDSGVKILNLRSYLFRTLANSCVDRLQSRSKMAVVNIDEVPDIVNTPEEYTEKDYIRITNMLATLPEEQAEVIRLRIYANKSFVEIATILAVPLSTVKSRFIYGLNKLRKQLISEDNRVIKPHTHDM